MNESKLRKTELGQQRDELVYSIEHLLFFNLKLNFILYIYLIFANKKYNLDTEYLYLQPAYAISVIPQRTNQNNTQFEQQFIIHNDSRSIFITERSHFHRRLCRRRRRRPSRRRFDNPVARIRRNSKLFCEASQRLAATRLGR